MERWNNQVNAAKLPERDSDDLADLVARLNGRNLGAPPRWNAETVKNHSRGVGAIECIKVDASHIVIQKIVALLQGEVNADAPDHFRIVFASLKSTQKL